MTGWPRSQKAPARGLASDFASFYVSNGRLEHLRGATPDADSAIERGASQTWCFAFSSAIGCFAALAWAHRLPSRRTQPLRIVVLGDSLVAGFQLKASEAFPAQLERALKARGHAVEVINAGVSGDTTAGGLERAALGRAGADRRRDPRARRQRCAARARPDARQGQPGQDHHHASRPTGAEVLLAGMFAPRNLGQDYAQRVRCHLPGPRATSTG